MNIPTSSGEKQKIQSFILLFVMVKKLLNLTAVDFLFPNRKLFLKNSNLSVVFICKKINFELKANMSSVGKTFKNELIKTD